jgi:hypothetical protein
VFDKRVGREGDQMNLWFLIRGSRRVGNLHDRFDLAIGSLKTSLSPQKNTQSSPFRW